MDTEVILQQPVSLWRNRDYLLLWLGQAVSDLGTSCTQFAFPLLIVGLTRSIAAAGLAYSLGQLPYVLLSLPAGALVDRWPRKRVMLLCTFCLMVCVASIPLALGLSSGPLRLLLLYAIAFGLGAISLFYELATSAARAWVVPKSQLPTAVAQNKLIVGSCALVGPALGSWLFSISRLLPFVTDALSSLILLGSLLSIRSPMQDERRTERHHLLREVREGLTWLWEHEVVRSILLISSYVNVTITASVLLVLAIVQQQHIPPVLYGLIVAAGGVGNLLGTALCPPMLRRIRFGRALCCALIVFVFVFPLYGFITTPLLLGAVFAGIALSDSISAIFMDSYRFAVVPDALQGRVSSIYRLILFSVLTIGSSALGLSLEHLGILPTVGIVWSGLLLITGWLFLSRHLRQATFPHE
ncbi:MFS transporter [Ktedonobacter racemifer]|uniref:Major facilitator superfamily MFS_1 n=1 Tax=Ktedonobacter racemifer DSM 44963 TaxID=485913 RepID=D6U764_KTERA|nr:MFS transporter [Ktedonobacter racemifer]EFH79725.1 major facilitator superfamily MFS_1 [Ktedonobacter racemifer DSM 44963]